MQRHQQPTTVQMRRAMIGGMIASYAVIIIVALIVGLIEIIGIVNMAYYDGDLGAAFRFSDILNYIATIGWGKYIITYIIIALIGMVITLVAMIYRDFNIICRNIHYITTCNVLSYTCSELAL